MELFDRNVGNGGAARRAQKIGILKWVRRAATHRFASLAVQAKRASPTSTALLASGDLCIPLELSRVCSARDVQDSGHHESTSTSKN